MSRVKTPREYEQTQQLLEQARDSVKKQRAALQAAGLSPEHVELGLQPLLSIQDQMNGELTWYDNARKGKIRSLSNLKRIGLSLIALRLAKGLTQRQLAERLGVNEAQVSKDEKNEYHGISVERAQRVIDAMGGSVTVAVSAEPPATPEWELAEAQARRAPASSKTDSEHTNSLESLRPPGCRSLGIGTDLGPVARISAASPLRAGLPLWLTAP